MQARTVSRRQMISGTAGALMALGLGSVAGCGSDDQPQDGTGGSAGTTSSPRATETAGTVAEAVLPDYIPFEGVSPDLAATAAGAQPGFFAYPQDRKPFIDKPPMDNGQFTAATIINDLPASHGGNQYWQELEKRLGARFTLIGAPTKEFGAKLQTMLAGGDLPDIVQMYRVNQLPQILKADFQDLTEHLAGDAIKEYPALANIPTVSWQSAVHNGGVFGVPQHRTPQKWSLIVRDDLAQELGVDIAPKNGDEFLDMCRALTDQRHNHWADRSPMNMLNYVNQMVGTPNAWKIEDGTFIRDYETDEMKDALSIIQKMWSDDLFHPDSFSSTSAQVIAWISSGTVRMVSGPGAFKASAMAVKDQDPSYSVVPIQPPKWEGGGFAKQYLGTAMLAITSLKKAEPDRVKGLLRVLNYLAAPFGTEEANFISYGIADRDYTVKDGAPELTAKGKSEVFTVGYMMSPPVVHYMPGYPDETKAEYNAEKAAVADGAPWPTSGLFSTTDETKGPALTKKMTDMQAEIIRGRSVSDWDDAVSAWKKNGGDAIAREYSEALAKSGGQ